MSLRRIVDWLERVPLMRWAMLYTACCLAAIAAIGIIAGYRLALRGVVLP